MAHIKPLVPILVGGAALAGGGYLILQQNGKLEELKSKIAAMGGGVNLSGGGGSLDLSFLGELFNNMQKAVSTSTPKIDLSGLFSPISDAVKSAENAINDTVENAKKAAADAKKAFDDSIKKLTDAPGNAVNGFSKGLASLLPNPSTNYGENIGRWFGKNIAGFPIGIFKGGYAVGAAGGESVRAQLDKLAGSWNNMLAPLVSPSKTTHFAASVLKSSSDVVAKAQQNAWSGMDIFRTGSLRPVSIGV